MQPLRASRLSFRPKGPVHSLRVEHTQRGDTRAHQCGDVEHAARGGDIVDGRQLRVRVALVQIPQIVFLGYAVEYVTIFLHRTLVGR